MQKHQRIIQYLFIIPILIVVPITIFAQSKWEWNNPYPLRYKLRSITFGAGLFVAVGESGVIITSQNGSTWVVRSSETTSTLRQVIYANNLFIAAGDSGTILTSKDAIKWVVAQSNTTDILAGVTYGNGKFAAVGLESALITSSDGYNWTNKPIDHNSEATCITFGNNKYLIKGNSFSINLISSDCSTWTNTIQEMGAYTNAVMYASGHFIALTSGSMYSSTDGIHWEKVDNIPVIGADAMCFGNDSIVVMANIGAIYKSNDGINWSSGTTGIHENLYSIAYGNNRYVAISESNSIWTTGDDSRWKNIYDNLQNDFSLRSVTYGNNQFFILATNFFLTSPDAKNWSYTKFNIDNQTLLNSVIFGNDQFVIVGNNGSILSSNDLKKWVKRSPGINFDLYDVAFGNNLFVAAGNNNSVITSPDGINWSAHPTGSQSIFSAITFKNNKFLAVGEFGSICVSSDGIVWNDCSLRNYCMLRSVTFGNNLYVAAGYVATGGPNDYIVNYISSDGWHWIESKPGITAVPRSVTYANNQFVMTCNSGHILTSTDGMKWKYQQSCTNYPLEKIVSGKNSFVAIGGQCVITSDFDALNVLTHKMNYQCSNEISFSFHTNCLYFRSIDLPSNDHINVCIYNATGKRVLSTIPIRQNAYFSIPSLQLIDGAYYISVTANNKNFYGSFIVSE
jgi:photosystem II stability/assembly factor-like uncharacterized protein